MQFDSTSTFKRVMLERTQFHLRKVFSPTEIANMRVEVYQLPDMFAENFAMELRYEVASEKLQRFTYKHPENWIEAVKERWFPAWLLRRYPVKFKVIKLNAKVLYPQISLPREQHFVIITQADNALGD